MHFVFHTTAGTEFSIFRACVEQHQGPASASSESLDIFPGGCRVQPNCLDLYKPRLRRQYVSGMSSRSRYRENGRNGRARTGPGLRGLLVQSLQVQCGLRNHVRQARDRRRHHAGCGQRGRRQSRWPDVVPKLPVVVPCRSSDTSEPDRLVREAEAQPSSQAEEAKRQEAEGLAYF